MTDRQSSKSLAINLLLAPRSQMVVAAFLFTVSTALPAAAQKTDVVTLTNGNIITGEIKGIDKGLIRLSTTSMGMVDVKWAYVAAIDSDKTLEVDLATGERVYGSVRPGDPGTLDVATGAEPTRVNLDEVAEVWPIGKSFWQKQNGNLDFGLTFTRANNQVQYNFNFRNTFNGRGYKIPLTVTSALTRIEDETTTNRHTVRGSWIRNLRGPKWFALVLGEYQRNDELDLDFRASAGGGVGRYLFESSRYAWATYGATIGTQERYASGVSTTTASVVAGTNMNVFIYGDHDLTFHTNFQAIPSLTGEGRVRLEFNTSVNYELFSSLYLGVNFYDQYDSNPPEEAAQQNDFGVSTTVGYKW